MASSATAASRAALVVMLLSLYSVHAYTQKSGEDILEMLHAKKHHLDTGGIHSQDVICNCSTRGCDVELIGLLGPEFAGLCRSKGGACRLQFVNHCHEDTLEQIVEYDCVREDELATPMLCHTGHYNNVLCCNDRSYCTSNQELEWLEVPPLCRWSAWSLLLWMLLALVFLALAFLASLFFPCTRRFLAKICTCIRCHKLDETDARSPLELEELRTEQTNLHSLLNDLDSTLNSGSGAGAAALEQRTVARQIELIKEIGAGRFGEVWLGKWHGNQYAVKIFSSRDERSWNREVEIFNTNMLRHANVLHFITHDNKDTGTSMQLWLVTEYHPNGSLFDYLEQHTVSEETAARMVRGIASGLAYLHSEIPGINAKPAIAHRDVKSKNILVKRDLECVIGDLGLAVRFENDRIDMPDNSKCGTVRYLCPEMLLHELASSRFDAFRAADMYAMGLVVWEIVSRMQCEHVSASPWEECIPYWSEVDRDPSMECMREVVVERACRPAINDQWAQCPVGRELSRVCRECWTANPASRLSAMNVRIAMDKLLLANGYQ